MRMSKIILVVLVLSFISSTINAQYISSLKLKQDLSLSKDSNKKALSEKSPLLAGILSFVVPGAAFGQIYNEDYGKFALHFGISAAIFTFAIVGNQAGLYEIYVGDPGGGTGKEAKRDWIFALCILAYTGNWIWSTIDAIHSAVMNNRELEQKKARLKSRTQKSIDYNFGFGLDRNNNLRFKTILNF